MKRKQRQAQIADVVGQTGQMSVEVLARRFGVSAETIRRDLGQLAESGAVQKVHGGAKRPRLHSEGSFHERMGEESDAKRLIARKLRGLLEPGDTIFIDTGSTTLFCAEALSTMERLTVITNSVRIAQVLGTPDARHAVYLVGGSFNGDSGETVGPLAIEQIGAFQADHAVLTVAAIDAGVGAMDSSFDEARVAREMINRSRQVFLVADATKFDRMAAFRVCGLDEIDVILSDRALSPAMTAALDAAGVELR